MADRPKVFISYVREDEEAATRLYYALRKAGADPWIDREDLLPGQQWSEAIQSAIEGCRYFLALLSNRSISKEGFAQKELRIALEKQDLMPQSQIFLIPARLEKCTPTHPRLRQFDYADLFEDYERAFSRILKSLEIKDQREKPPKERPVKGKGAGKDAKLARPQIQIGRDVTCADFVGRDQTHITFGYTAEHLERLIEKVLQILKQGALFSPRGLSPGRDSAIEAEWGGETLRFASGAVALLFRSRDERSYLVSLLLHQEYQVWASHYVPLAGKMDEFRCVEGFHMPLNFTELRVCSGGPGQEGQVTAIPLQDITEALGKYNAFVVLGEPGSGKTTTLQKIALEEARKMLEGRPGRIPLFVKLDRQRGLGPEEFLEREWKIHTGSDFLDALSKGKVLVLADGINEVAQDERSSLIRDWKRFAEAHKATNQVIFTCREKDYDRQLNLPRVRIEPLDDPRIIEYLKRYEAEEVVVRLKERDSSLWRLARNPFFLMLLSRFYKALGQKPSMAELLGHFVEELFKRERDIAEHWIDPEIQARALSVLAYGMQSKGEGEAGRSVPLDKAIAMLPTEMKHQGETHLLNPVHLIRLARGATILNPNEVEDVRFYHQLLQEYLAALELKRRFVLREDLAPKWKCERLGSKMPEPTTGEWDPLPPPPSTGWEMTTILACEMISRPVDLVDAVLPHNPVLAGRCIHETRREFPEDLKDRVREALHSDLYNPKIHLRARLQAGLTLGRVEDPRFKPRVLHGVKFILPELVPVPAGTYFIGSSEADKDAFPNEHPRHPVQLDAFSIGRWPVTNAQLECFIRAGGYQEERYWKGDLAKRWLRGGDAPGGPPTGLIETWEYLRANPDWREEAKKMRLDDPARMKFWAHISSFSKEELIVDFKRSVGVKSRSAPHFWENNDFNNPSQPVAGITWFEAWAYCEWLASVTGRTFRLPTEVEWEAAARGRKGYKYPWSDKWEQGRANTIEGRVLRPSPVGAYAAGGGVGPFKAEDQCGNVWEWTSTLHKAYPYQPEDREDLEAEGERVLRGGSWDLGRRYARCASRLGDVPDFFDDCVGFRVVSPGLVSES